jgi:hypothetical protein
LRLNAKVRFPFRSSLLEPIMTRHSSLPVIATFANRGLAEAAVDELWHEGFEKSEIGIASPGESLQQATTSTEHIEEAAEHGAVLGAVAGSALGAVAGAVVAATIPGFGAVIAGGLLTGIVGGAAGGAALGTFAGPFLAMGFSEEETHHIEADFRSGRTIVVVQTNDRQEEAARILRSHGPLSLKVAGSLSSRAR